MPKEDNHQMPKLPEGIFDDILIWPDLAMVFWRNLGK